MIQSGIWQRNAVRGALWMAAASTMIALSAACVRELSGSYSAFQLVFLRSAIGVMLMLPWLVRMARHGTLRTNHLPLYVLRTVLSYTGMVCVFFGLANMPIGEVYALLFLVPLITIVLAVLILREKAGSHAWVACAVGFIGALVILRPGIIAISLAAAAVLVTALVYGATNICIKVLTRTDGPVQITIYGNLLNLILAVVPALLVWRGVAWADAPWILALGLFQTLAGLFHARAVHAADARVVQPFNFLRLPISVLVAYLLFAELPSPWTWLGAGLIFASSYYVLYRESGMKSAERDQARYTKDR